MRPEDKSGWELVAQTRSWNFTGQAEGQGHISRVQTGPNAHVGQDGHPPPKSALCGPWPEGQGPLWTIHTRTPMPQCPAAHSHLNSA